MSLAVGAGDFINHGSAASLDNLEPWTMIVWVKPATFATTFASFLSKGVGGERLQTSGGASSNNPSGAWQKAPSTFYVSNHELTTTEPWCIAIVHDDSAGDDERFQIYAATLAAALAETTYSLTDEGGSATPNDSSGSLGVGGLTDGSKSMQGDYYAVAVFSGAVTLAALEACRRLPWKARFITGCVLACEYSWHTGTQHDYSGSNNHGTPSGVTVTTASNLMLLQHLVSCGVVS